MAHDGSSVLLDRFGLLLLLVLSTVVGQALIDVGGSFLGSSVAHAISGAALLVAVRAAGVTTRWRRAADLLVAVVLAVNVVLVLLQLLPGERLEMEPATGPEFLWLIAAALAPVVVARGAWSSSERSPSRRCWVPSRPTCRSRSPMRSPSRPLTLWAPGPCSASRSRPRHTCMPA